MVRNVVIVHNSRLAVEMFETSNRGIAWLSAGDSTETLTLLTFIFLTVDLIYIRIFSISVVSLHAKHTEERCCFA